MQTKLTLRLEADLIARAKAYAHTRSTSLSRLVATYFKSLERQHLDEGEVNPLVKELLGAASSDQSPESLIEEYHRYLNKKYQ